jgi:hypothetical protein
MFEAAGGADGLLRLANARHQRVMADEVIGHSFSHGFHPSVQSESPHTARKRTCRRVDPGSGPT